MESHYRQAIKTYRAVGNHKEAERLETLCFPEVSNDQELPEEGAFIWSLFLSMPRTLTLGYGCAIVQETSLADLEAYCRLHGGVELAAWELEAFRRLDRLRVNMENAELRAAAEQSRRSGSRG